MKIKYFYSYKKVKILLSNIKRKCDITKNTAHYKLLSFAIIDFVYKH